MRFLFGIDAHDIPHPIGDPDDDEELPEGEPDEDEDDDEDGEEPMQLSALAGHRYCTAAHF